MRSFKAYARLIAVLGIVVFVFVFFRVFVRKIISAFSPSHGENIRALQLKNAVLSLELERIAFSSSSAVSSFRHRARVVSVYSRYPFNDKRTLVIDFGSVDGAAEGMPVAASTTELLGVITKVRKFQSEVQTIFDSSWTTSVEVGKERFPAVLRGGVFPVLEFVPEIASLSDGDVVKNVSPEFPLGFAMGVVSGVDEESGGTPSLVHVLPSFSFDSLREVYVLTEF